MNVGSSDPYLELKLNKLDTTVKKSKVIDDNLNPEWNEQAIFNIDIKNPDDENLVLHVKCLDYGKIYISPTIKQLI